MTVRVRIAPSPTGNLHIGTARTALFNWLFARHHQGEFILRIEDTDQERSQPEFTENIIAGLQWLGLHWDIGPIWQTQRTQRYREIIEQLLAQKLAYHSYETEAELQAMRAQQEAQKQAPRYTNQHRHLTPEQIAEFIAQGRQPVIRFQIDDQREIVWHDLVRGAMRWRGSDLGGDMVIARADGQPLYNFAVVVDDIDMQISHVIRGEDHIANTAKQILIYEALNAPIPDFAHTPLILNAEGRKLSKRDGVTSIFDFRNMGYLAVALTNYMTLLGWSPPAGEELFTLAEAVPLFSLERVNKAGGKFDWDKLNWINSHYIRQLSTKELCGELLPFWQQAGYGFNPESDQPWLWQLTELIAPSLVTLKDGVDLARFYMRELPDYDPEAIAQLQQMESQPILTALLAQTSPEDTDTAKQIVQTTVQQCGVKKGAVMKTLRAALMGSMHGPDLIQSWLILHQRRYAQLRLSEALQIAQGKN
ncbi:Glutamyl-tRNA synthetase [Gloeomargarita lithophora Alchichica-D10]|uniref:Glutamate--tRNA ligase n=1 Tax=Gloeomargarita lithophora Alchichica-D10 TaxID=1188229 RepID=A0A1J0AE45_9CYAN|nr:glutamate--tRNA ligase [Gloeomargarita lithophora]APB34171.1 Glutamyl-tRNA synthetase [Gloeomargarita lithophora Alchichica-D10]